MAVLLKSPLLLQPVQAGCSSGKGLNLHHAGFTLRRQQHRRGQQQHRKRSKNGPAVLTFASIGFSTDPRIQIERAANGLLKDVAMLLVYQEVFRSPPAQAFLKLLLALRRRDDSLKLLEAYGEFFRLMAVGQYASWEDFILEGILKAEGNPFAEAAAGIGYPESTYSGEVPASLEAAAISDLESLQRLSITESTLSSWVTELEPETKPEWRSAAASNLSCRSVRKVSSANNEKKQSIGFTFAETDSQTTEDNSSAITSVETAESVNEKKVNGSESDVITSEREGWRKKIGGLWKWSEAVPLLKQYHAECGFGRVAVSQVVKWKGGRLVPDFKYLKAGAAPDLTVWSGQQAEFLKNLRNFHGLHSAAQHVFLHGQPGSGKSWLLRSTLSKLADERRFRVLILPSTELKQVGTLLEELRKNSNLRFVVVVDDLFSRAVEESFVFLKSAMDEHFQQWPENVLLCATSTRSEARIGDSNVNLGDIFGLSIGLSKLDEQQYLICVDQILEHQLKSRQLSLVRSTDEIHQDAMEWGQKTSLNVKHAAQFVESILE